ncbi:MAG TPA: HAD family phosphatase [Crinalium sp.]
MISTTSTLPTALIFDCDGTLANTLPVHFHAWSTTFQTYGVTIAEDWFYRHCGVSAVEMIELFNRSFGYQLDASQVNQDRQQRYRSLISAVKEIKVVADIARAHYNVVPMAVASGGERSLLEATLNAIGLRNLFDVVVSVNDVAQGKPAPDLFLLAAQRLQVTPADCLVYEDSVQGLEAARLAGID